MRDGGIKMVSNMRSSDLVVQEVDYAPWVQLVVWAIDGMQSSLNKGVLVL